MNRHALDVLQFPNALAVIAGSASSSLGAAAVRALTPSTDRAWIEHELERVDQMGAFLQRSDAWSPGTIPDVRASVQRLGVAGSVLDAPSLRDIAILSQSGRAARAGILQHEEAFPLLADTAHRLGNDARGEESIRHAIDDAGEVKDHASRELAKIRRELRSTRGRIVKQLEEYAAALPARYQVQDASVTVREGRYVIPIRREGRGDVGGIVHDESATGGTLFVEPPVAIELMNRLRELEIAETREVQRILRELTDTLRPSQPMFQATLDTLVVLDSLYARGRYMLQTGGHRPELLHADSRVRYNAVFARHALLLAQGAAVVPFDLMLDADERTLLVSGPNTGGKTVLLKAVGLMSALAQSGVVPPTGSDTRLPLFRDIYADIGDEQSIEASLSTFSAHLRNLREIVEHAGSDSLVLIDEIGSGTDPAEGAALAQAILLELTRRGTMTVATTHLGQLKLLATEDSGVVNASLQFDAAELRPTYRLVKGVPGRSYGLAIARRLGFPVSLLESAEEALPRTERDAARLLGELESRERELADALDATAAAQRETTALRAELDERVAEMRRRERDAERRARQQARDLLLNARQEVEAAIAQVRAAASATDGGAALDVAAHAARRRIEEQVRTQSERTPAAEPVTGAARSTRAVEEGSYVRIEATGAEGTVVELRDKRAVVEVGGVRMQVPARGLVAVQKPKTKSGARGGWYAPDFDASPEVDLRGLRADEAIAKLQPALDAAIQAALPSFRIVHGKGTGALRELVTDLVKDDPRIRSQRPGGIGEGGAGVTVLELR
ncbi:MAG TPA: endonuclease MutS2 [Longimicrobiales bacterium]